MIIKHHVVLFVTVVIYFVLSMRLLEFNVTALGQSDESFVINCEFIIKPLVLLRNSFLHVLPPFFKLINPLQKVGILKVVPI